MDTQKVKLSQVTENVENPRTITDRNLQKLITSILVFPKMLALRPIVVDDTMTALGGNMRLRALSAISTFSPDEFGDDFTLPDGEKGNIETLSFILSNEQAEFVKAKLEVVEVCDTYDNKNKNGNAIYEIVRQWDAARK